MDKSMFGILYGFVVFFLCLLGVWFFYKMILKDTPEIERHEKTVLRILIFILILGAVFGMSKLMNKSNIIPDTFSDPENTILEIKTLTPSPTVCPTPYPGCDSCP